MAKIYTTVKANWQTNLELLYRKRQFNSDYLAISSTPRLSTWKSGMPLYSDVQVFRVVVNEEGVKSEYPTPIKWVHKIHEAVALVYADLELGNTESANATALLNNIQTTNLIDGKTIFELLPEQWVSEETFINNVLPNIPSQIV